MTQVLGIVGSLRNLGNCELLVKEVSRQISVPHELRLLRLPEFRLQYCNGCYRCLAGDRGCVLQDDLGVILEAIAGADALILAVPTYFLSGPACLKALVDRAISFYARAEQLWGKPAVGLGIAGIAGKEGSTLLDIEHFFATLMAQNKANRILYGALPGEALLSEENRRQAKALADALFAPAESKSGLCCPGCGGATFRFAADSRVRCMLCSAAGRLVSRAGQQTIELDEGEHSFLNSHTTALEHRDWLLGMVDNFKRQKKALSEVRAAYRDTADWIKPKTEC